ncbi:hypothetical protein F5Y16DRAFT_373957 [Xylariaceae sp. FL0255]|nr:hypothetical protein F5Y16DRAFT_373957 [Xylariaceae sp. FL0255]
MVSKQETDMNSERDNTNFHEQLRQHDLRMQRMLLEQQNKKRLMMARQQEGIGSESISQMQQEQQQEHQQNQQQAREAQYHAEQQVQQHHLRNPADKTHVNMQMHLVFLEHEIMSYKPAVRDKYMQCRQAFLNSQTPNSQNSHTDEPDSETEGEADFEDHPSSLPAYQPDQPLQEHYQQLRNWEEKNLMRYLLAGNWEQYVRSRNEYSSYEEQRQKNLSWLEQQK